jgi:NitT/TauT family transport system permease protein
MKTIEGTASDGRAAGAVRGRSPWTGRALSSVGPPLLTVVLLVLVWELAVKAFALPLYLLPAPSVIAGYFVGNFGLLWRHTLATAWAIVLGFLLSAAIGFPLGVIVVESRLFARTIYPLIVASQTFPKLAIAPLFIVWFGYGLTPKLLVAFLIAFFPILIDTAVGLQSVREETQVLARSIGLGPLQTFLKIRLPQAMPSILGGLKIGITLAVVGAVVGEFLGTDVGLGYLIVQSTGTLNTPLLFSALIALTILGLIFYALVSIAERLAVPWHAEAEERSTASSM